MSIVKKSFDSEIAKLVGTDAAIIYSNIEFWIKTNEANRVNFFDNKYWMYHSIKAFCKLFDYLTESQIKTCLSKLEKENLIEIGNYNQIGYDRTKWYSIPLKSTISEKSQMDLSNFANPLDENRQPIQDIKTDSKKDINNNEIDFNSLAKYYNYAFDKQMKIVNDKCKRQFNKLIKLGYTKVDIKKVIDNASNDKFHEENDFKHLTLEFISREEKFEKYFAMPHEKPRCEKLKKPQGHTNH
jgi:hypothetical protein